ncbi:MAG: hypothetical protein DMG53_28105, partial [Acidobacteria bacterium]
RGIRLALRLNKNRIAGGAGDELKPDAVLSKSSEPLLAGLLCGGPSLLHSQRQPLPALVAQLTATRAGWNRTRLGVPAWDIFFVAQRLLVASMILLRPSGLRCGLGASFCCICFSGSQGRKHWALTAIPQPSFLAGQNI